MSKNVTLVIVPLSKIIHASPSGEKSLTKNDFEIIGIAILNFHLRVIIKVFIEILMVLFNCV